MTRVMLRWRRLARWSVGGVSRCGNAWISIYYFWRSPPSLFWQSASTGYQVVLAPEGVSQTAVSYQAFLAPLCSLVGSGLLTFRLCLMASAMAGV